MIQRYSRYSNYEEDENGAWITYETHTAAAERGTYEALEAMRAACIASVEVTMKANGWDETTIACTVAAMREVQT